MLNVSKEQEDKIIECKVAMCLNDTLNHFLSEYHEVIEGICIAYPNKSREEVTIIVDKFLKEKREVWEAQCLEELRSTIQTTYEKFEAMGPLATIVSLLENLK